ncbi:MAG TPA: fibro-slime domain-containing protein [Polyangiales bacterium]|nr:fibro-slime domain-containing protein [Polyangiales bacterium]
MLLLACSESSPTPRDAGDIEPGFDAGAQPHLVEAGTVTSPAVDPALPPPGDFISTELGGYKLGPALMPGSTDLQLNLDKPAGRCSQLVAVVRDFRGAREANAHPDFEVFDGKKPTQGLLAAQLGSDRKPVYASRCEKSFDAAACPYGQMTTSRAAFEQWYRSTPDVNATYALYLAFEANGDVYTFQSKSFFPLDGAGFGNAGGKRKHNFGFTTELHATFTYRGGEQFSFTGDDDLWVFVNGKLAIDLGGLHPPATGTLDLDAAQRELGIEPGREYTLDLFHAERHSAASNFRVDTTIQFSDCGRVSVELL